MKDDELQFDHSCHVLYSKTCKKEIQSKIALHYCQKQAEKVAIRHGGHGSHSDGAGGNDDSTVIGKTLLSAAFSGFLQRSVTMG